MCRLFLRLVAVALVSAFAAPLALAQGPAFPLPPLPPLPMPGPPYPGMGAPDTPLSWGGGPPMVPPRAPMAAQPSADACLEMSAHKAAARTYLKLRLDLDKQQAPLWNELEAIAAENDTAMLELCTDRPANPEGRSLVARSERAEIRLDRRLAALKALNVPLRKLYATLSAEQRAVVDALPMPLPF